MITRSIDVAGMCEAMHVLKKIMLLVWLVYDCNKEEFSLHRS